MSRIGKKPINIPSGVETTITTDQVKIKGPKGELFVVLHKLVNVVKENNDLIVKINNPENKDEKALWGTSRKLIANAILGITDGFEKKLEINGVGYNASISGNKLTLNLGFSHPVIFNLAAGINGKVEKNIIILSGIDKQLIGEQAAQIRRLKKPEPYKGKGIKYIDEQIRRKAGKAVKTAGK